MTTWKIILILALVILSNYLAFSLGKSVMKEKMERFLSKLFIALGITPEELADANQRIYKEINDDNTKGN